MVTMIICSSFFFYKSKGNLGQITGIFLFNDLKFSCSKNMAYCRFLYLVFHLLENIAYTRDVVCNLSADYNFYK
jgi:hypothetical protein